MKKFLLFSALALAVIANTFNAQAVKWDAVNNPIFGGRVNAVGATPNGTVYAGTQYGGLFKSTDTCKSWTYINYSDLEIRDIMAISDDSCAIATNDGIYFTINNGTDWLHRDNFILSKNMFCLTKNASGDWYTANKKEVYKSTNMGNDWTATAEISSKPNNTCLVISYSGKIFRGTETGLFMSENDGTSWTAVTVGSGTPEIVEIVEVSANYMYLCTKNEGVFVSVNSGSSWVYKGLKDKVIFDACTFNLKIIVASDEGYFVTEGTDFITNYTGIPVNEVNMFLPTPTKLIAATDGAGIYISDTGSDFTEANNGLTAVCINAVRADSDPGTLYLAAFGKGVYKTTSGGAIWNELNNDLNNRFVFDIAIGKDGHLFALTDAGVSRYDADENKWRDVNHELPLMKANTIAINSAGDIFVGTDNSGVYRANETGENWVSTSLTSNYEIRDITIDANGGIWAGIQNSGLYFSDDNGATWQSKNTEIGAQTINCVFVASNGNIWVGTGANGVYLSTNDGVSFVKKGLDFMYISAITEGQFGSIAVSSPSGVLSTTNKGNTWELINDGLSNLIINTLISNSWWEVYAGSIGGGVFKTSAISSVENQSSQTSLEVYPNPASGKTALTFDGFDESNVTITITDLLGNEVIKNIENFAAVSGKNTFTFNANILAPGAYFAIISNGTMSQSAKFTVK